MVRCVARGKSCNESLVEEVALELFGSLDYRILLGPEVAPGEPVALYSGPLPKAISCEIMINNVKNPSETKT